MSCKISDSATLDQLVSGFENNEHELTDVPKAIVDKYGYACLADALMFKEPAIPKYDEKIVDIIKNKTFKTLDSLVSFIKTFKTDIDKLFAIFTYTALNIEYDVELFFSGQHKSTSVEEVFRTKKAACEGYALFLRGVAEKVNIDKNRFDIRNYSNFSKAFGFNAFNPPKEVKSDHASVYIKIDGVPFISEPTWASGHLTDDKKFEWNFRKDLFLVPILKTLCDHFPCDECYKLLPVPITFSQFYQSMKVYAFDRRIKTESNPFNITTCSTGYGEFVYSANGPVDHIGYRIFKKKGDTLTQISINGITSYQITQASLPKHPERFRFKSCILFQEIALYKVDISIDGPIEISFYIDNKKKNLNSVPLTYNPFHESRFIPISPKQVLTKVKNGLTMIRFAVAMHRSELLWNIIKLPNNKSYEDGKGQTIDRTYAKYTKLLLPFDDERYEDQILITFPSNGRYSFKLFLSNDEGSFTSYATYYFDVTGVNPEDIIPKNPVYYVYKGRTFAPRNIRDTDNNDVIVKPNLSCYMVTKRDQSLQFKTHSIDDELYFELKHNGKTVLWPKISGQNGNFRVLEFTLPDEYGEYALKGWVNDHSCIDLLFVYLKNELKEPTKAENQLLSELKDITDNDQVKIQKRKEEEERKRREEEERKRKEEEMKKKEEEEKRRKDEENKRKKIEEEKNSEEVASKKESKCCLLI